MLNYITNNITNKIEMYKIHEYKFISKIHNISNIKQPSKWIKFIDEEKQKYIKDKTYEENKNNTEKVNNTIQNKIQNKIKYKIIEKVINVNKSNNNNINNNIDKRIYQHIRVFKEFKIEEEKYKIILIRENIIDEIINNDDMFFDNYRKGDIPKEVIGNILKYIVNNEMSISRFTKECKKFEIKPKWKCPIRLFYQGYYLKTIRGLYLYYRSENTECNKQIIDIKTMNDDKVFNYLSRTQYINFYNYDYKKLNRLITSPVIYIPKLAKIEIIDNMTPCIYAKQFNECLVYKRIETMLALIYHYKYILYLRMCNELYDIIKDNKIKDKQKDLNEIRMVYRLVKYINGKEYNKIQTLNEIIEEEYRIEYNIHIGDDRYILITNQIEYDLS